MIRLKRVSEGHYETRDGKYRITHWDRTAGNRESWCIADWDQQSATDLGHRKWEFVCEVRTLSDARKWLSGENVSTYS